MDTQNFEFLPEGDTPDYKNTWRHTIAGIGYVAIAVLILYLTGRPQWHQKLLIFIGLWTCALIYVTYKGKFITKIVVDKLVGTVTVYYYNVNTGENSKIFNIQESDISYKFKMSRSPVWQLIISDQEMSFKLTNPYLITIKSSRNKLTKENLDRLYKLLSN